MLVEVVFAEPQRQIVVEVSLPHGACVQDALQAAVADPKFLSIDLAARVVGIYGQVCERDQPLKPGDRVELYRELPVDAKTARRQRAQIQQQGRQQVPRGNQQNKR